MSLFLLLCFIVAVLRGRLSQFDDEYLFGWALFAIADALWIYLLWGIVYGG